MDNIILFFILFYYIILYYDYNNNNLFGINLNKNVIKTIIKVSNERYL